MVKLLGLDWKSWKKKNNFPDFLNCLKLNSEKTCKNVSEMTRKDPKWAPFDNYSKLFDIIQPLKKYLFNYQNKAADLILTNMVKQ